MDEAEARKEFSWSRKGKQSFFFFFPRIEIYGSTTIGELHVLIYWAVIVRRLKYHQSRVHYVSVINIYRWLITVCLYFDFDTTKRTLRFATHVKNDKLIRYHSKRSFLTFLFPIKFPQLCVPSNSISRDD